MAPVSAKRTKKTSSRSSPEPIKKARRNANQMKIDVEARVREEGKYVA